MRHGARVPGGIPQNLSVQLPVVQAHGLDAVSPAVLALPPDDIAEFVRQSMWVVRDPAELRVNRSRI
jgi:hypothetical protein